MFEFIEACKEGDIQTVKEYLADKKFTGLNEKDEHGNTPFFWACGHGHKEVVELLIEADGFNSLNEKNNSCNTPFFWACCCGYKEIAELLIKTDGFNSLNDKNNSGYTPFFGACFNGHKKVVELLIKTRGFSSLNEKDNDDCTPFFGACHNGHKEVVKLLLTCSDIIISDNVDTKNKKIKKLIERYKKDPIMTRSSLILKEYIILYRHIVFLCDNYYKLNEKTENENGLRFTARKIIIFTSVILKIRTL